MEQWARGRSFLNIGLIMMGIILLQTAFDQMEIKMKKILLLILITVFTVSSLSAFGKKEEKRPAAAQQNNIEAPNDINSITLEKQEITGLVEKGFKNMICIVENPSSKSRVSYYPDEKAAKKA